VLEDLLRSPTVGRVNIVAHSVGTMLTMEALRQLHAKLGDYAADRIARWCLPRRTSTCDVSPHRCSGFGPLAPKITIITATDDRALAVVAVGERQHHPRRGGREGAAREVRAAVIVRLVARLGHPEITIGSYRTPAFARRFAMRSGAFRGSGVAPAESNWRKLAAAGGSAGSAAGGFELAPNARTTE